MNQVHSTFKHGLLAAAVLAALPALAQDKTMQAIEVRERPLRDATVHIGAEDIGKTGARDMRELFQTDASLSVGGGGNAIAQKLYIRGLEDTMLNVSLDGATQGGYIYHHQARTVVDPAMLKQVSVEKGLSSPSAGPGAMAGSVRFETKDASDLLRPGQRFGGMLSGGYNDNDGSKYGVAVYGKPVEAADFLVSLTRQDTDDYKDGNGRTQALTASKQEADLVKLSIEPVAGHRLIFGYNGIRDAGTRYQRPHMVAYAAPNATPRPHEFERETYTGRYRFGQIGFVGSGELGVYVDANENVRIGPGSGSGAAPIRKHGEKVTGDGINLLLRSSLGAHALRYGLNYQNLDAEALNAQWTGRVKNGLTNRSKENARVAGLFFEGSFLLSDAFVLDVGARHDSYDYTDNFGQDFSSNGLSPNLKLSWLLGNELVAYAGASSVWRGVGLQETWFLDNAQANNHANTTQAATTLKGERARNREIGFRYKSGPLMLTGAVHAMTIGDYISLTRVNAGNLESSGYELSAQWTAGDFSVGAGVAQSKPKLNGQALCDGDMSLGTTTGRTWNFNAAYALAGRNLDIGWNARVLEEIGPRPHCNSASVIAVAKPGYAVHDIYARWQPLGRDKLNVRLGINNLFDKFYYDQASFSSTTAAGVVYGYADPGRNVRLDLSWKF